MANPTVSLKLQIDTKGRRVLYAEAGKDFVDFLFNIPSLPLGTVIKLLTRKSMVGCLGNLYQSIENLSETYMLHNLDKTSLLEPKSPIHFTKVSPLLFPKVDSSCEASKPLDYNLKLMAASERCRTNGTMALVALQHHKNASSSLEGGGYVKGAVTYMVMDDLEVTPMSTNSIISILNKFNVTDHGDIEERVIEFGLNEAKNLLKASLQSRAVLTYLFLGEPK